jgi:hypothetical protein
LSKIDLNTEREMLLHYAAVRALAESGRATEVKSAIAPENAR